MAVDSHAAGCEWLFLYSNYPTVVAAINFDRTGTTRIGKYVLNHSFMVPGLIATIAAVVTGLLLVQLLGVMH